MKCPYCGYSESKVIDSRPADDDLSIRRRRECNKCLRRFTTYEQVENFPVFVIKKDGRRDQFDRRKILNGIIKACEKRPVSAADIEELATDIEQFVRSAPGHEVTSQALGELVMERLMQLDEVAYVRFASVYRRFKDVDTFISEIQKVKESRPPDKPPLA